MRHRKTFVISIVEVTQDKTVCELIVRLRYASKTMKIHTLDAGMFHCNVTKKEVVQNADATFRLCITSLRGKTHKRAAVLSSCCAAQVQQILLVDLFFIMTISILLEELVPLGLTLFI
jgi:hypothetical protein